MTLIAQEKYFVLHAPRKTGKTSTLYLVGLDGASQSEAGEYQALYINVEAAQAFREDVNQAVHVILGELVSQARTSLYDGYPEQVWQQVLQNYGGGQALNQLLTQWSAQSIRPLILLIDEIDSLIGDTRISVLRQLRAGYAKRPGLFPQSVVLCGVRLSHPL